VTPYDAVFVGSGINSLAGAALLAKEGWRVCVLERNDWLGGAIRTVDGLTAPGYRHEAYASWHPLWTGSPAYAELQPGLERLGVEYVNTDLPTATAFPDGTSVFLSTDGAANAAELGEAWQRQFDEFMARADLAFGVLGTELWSPQGLSLGRRAWSQLGRRGLVEFAAHALLSARDWLGETFPDERAHGLLAPWVLHTGLGPDDATSGFMCQVIACALQLGGMPVPKGGGVVLVDALAELVREAGGSLRTGAEVERVLVSDGKATGVRLAGGEPLEASRAVLACVTPTQLYGRLLAEGEAPAPVHEAARRFRYGRGEMQIHLALSEAPRWRGDERLARTPIVHLTAGLDGVSRAVNEAVRGLLPAEATVVVGQPLALDPSRAPDGAGILWIQLQELPSRPAGDAAGELDARGEWTEELREAYADRIVERIGAHVENLAAATVARVVMSPADMAAANPNWVGGDIYGGACTLDQNLVFRPLAAQPGHETPVERLWHIGASTHPGPGLGAGSGYLVAKRLTRPPLPRRLLSRLPGVS
jgi:phytoene dehydrogenase-like protein